MVINDSFLLFGDVAAFNFVCWKYLKWQILILYNFNRKKSSKFPVYLKFVPRKHSNLHDNTWKEIFYLENNYPVTNRDSEFSDKFHSALDRLKNTRKLVLLHHLSTELIKNVGNHPLLMRFHMLAMTLEPKYGSNGSVVPGSSVTREKRALFQEDKHNTCQDLRSDPYNNDCLGMCGPGCTCWSRVCGNCCRNQFCYEHDLCCGHAWISTGCLLPFIHTMSCENGYGGYPSCLQWVNLTLHVNRPARLRRGGGGSGEGNRRECLLLLGMCRWPFRTPSPV